MKDLPRNNDSPRGLKKQGRAGVPEAQAREGRGLDFIRDRSVVRTSSADARRFSKPVAPILADGSVEDEEQVAAEVSGSDDDGEQVVAEVKSVPMTTTKQWRSKQCNNNNGKWRSKQCINSKWRSWQRMGLESS